MAKWKQLPTDPVELHELLGKLRDKEMKLEADLAIASTPTLGGAITKLALATAGVKKMDANLMKLEMPDEDSRIQAKALATRIEYLRNQLVSAEQLLQDTIGDSAKKLLELREHREQEFDQLCAIYDSTNQLFDTHDIPLGKLLPSTADFVAKMK